MANGTYSNQCPVPCPHLPLHFASDFLAWDSEALLAASVYPAYILISHPSHPTSALRISTHFNSKWEQEATGSRWKQFYCDGSCNILQSSQSRNILHQSSSKRSCSGSPSVAPSPLSWCEDPTNQQTHKQTEKKLMNELNEWQTHCSQNFIRTVSFTRGSPLSTALFVRSHWYGCNMLQC